VSRHQAQNVIRITKGLDIPIQGLPEQRISGAAVPVRSVALLGHDYVGLRPDLLVAEGDRVRLGQPLFTDKNKPSVQFTSPGAGRVAAVNRGERRRLQSVVVELEGEDEVTHQAWPAAELPSLDEARVRRQLLASGLWTALRTRPFGWVPDADAEVAAIFVNAIDTNPLAPDPGTVIAARPDDFCNGLTVLAGLTRGTVHVCVAPESRIPCPTDGRVRVTAFAGPHPAGLPGTHIHFLAPVGPRRSVWYLNYQDAIAIGVLFTTGRILAERVIALAGPSVSRPRLVLTRCGASTDDLVCEEIAPGPVRIVSGSVLSGRQALGGLAYLGRYHLQVSVLPEGEPREFLGWLSPGLEKFSAGRSFLSSLFPGRHYALTTSQHGSPRAMVAIGSFERVMPLHLLPTPLLKALLVRDTEVAQALGCLELEEEDLALCSFVCRSKYDYGEALRECLTLIEQEN
jgi:Na+-transporting NADH:ubiquinone oxidoreductase subunit A